jgi:hypothetical protein
VDDPGLCTLDANIEAERILARQMYTSKRPSSSNITTNSARSFSRYSRKTGPSLNIDDQLKRDSSSRQIGCCVTAFKTSAQYVTCAGVIPAGPVMPRQAPMMQSADCSFQVGVAAKGPDSRSGPEMPSSRMRPAFSSESTLAAVTAQTSAPPVTMSATASSAVSNTRMVGALTSPPDCRVSFAKAIWLGFPRAVDNATVTDEGSWPRRKSRSAPVFIREPDLTANAMYSVTSVAIGTYFECSKLAAPTR